MDAQDFRSLQEAYLEVYQLDEEETGRGPRLIDTYDKPPYSDKVKDASKYKPLRKGPKRKGVIKKEEVDLYDIILSHLLDEGYKPPKGKMTKRVAHKWLKGVNTLTTAHGAGENLDPKGGTVGGQIAVQKSEKLGRQAQKIYQTAQRHNPEASKEKERQNRAVGDTARKEGPISAAALRDRFKKTGTNTPKKKNNYGKAVRDGIISGINDALGEEYDIYDIILSHLLDEGYAETPEAAEAIMVNMSEEWREDIVEAATDQSDKQIEKGVKTTYKAGNVLDNLHQGRSRGLSRLSPREREAKTERMRKRLKTRRDDLFNVRREREDEARAEMKKKYGL